jgi:hypothetical protein
MFPAIGSATIVVNRRIFGVGIGATMNHVRRTLGSPSHVERSGTVWLYRGRHLRLLFDSVLFGGLQSRVSFLSTTNPGQRTARGAGVGSTKQDVLRLVRGVRCRRPQKSGTDCLVASKAATVFGVGTYTDFHLGSKGLVDEVYISVY